LTVHLARGFQTRGHTVGIYARSANITVPEGTVEVSERFGAGIVVQEVAIGTVPHPASERFRERQSERFLAFLREFQPDVVHFHHLLYHSLDYPAIARSLGIRTVLTLHDFWYVCPALSRTDFSGAICDRRAGVGCLPCLWGDKRASILSRDRVQALSRSPLHTLFAPLPEAKITTHWLADSQRTLEAVDVLISPSHFVANDVVQSGICHPHLHVLDNGIPAPGKTPPSPHDGILRLGIIGLHRLKGGEVALEAFRRLPPTLPIRLLIYGTDSVENLPLNAEVCGRFTSDEIESVYGSFDALIVPSLWYENAPIVIREAFARNRPVLTSGIGGMAESVRDGVDGLHFAVGDADALMHTIQRLVEEPDLLAHLKQGIRPPKFMEEHLTELEAIYGGLEGSSAP
jgi:glycosyltransferase involved in cell wall biosynthesis